MNQLHEFITARKPAQLNPTAIVVLAYLLAVADAKGHAVVKLRDIHQGTGIKQPASLRKVLEFLVVNSWITIESGKAESKPNRYTVHTNRLPTA